MDADATITTTTSAPSAGASQASAAPASATQAPTSGETTSTAAAPAGGASATPPPAQAETYEVTIDGQKLQVSRDELLRGYQRGAAARRRFEEANQARAELERQIQAIKNDPWAVLQRAGVDPDQAAQARIMALIQREQQAQAEAQLPPEIRQALEEGRQAREEAARLKAQLDQGRKGQLDAGAKAYMDKWNQALPQAMEKAGLPKTAEAASMVVQTMKTMHKAGHKPDPVEAAEMVRDELYQQNFRMLRNLPEAQIVEALGKDALDKLQRHLIEKAKGPQPVAKQPEKPQSLNGQARKWMSAQEWKQQYE